MGSKGCGIFREGFRCSGLVGDELASGASVGHRVSKRQLAWPFCCWEISSATLVENLDATRPHIRMCKTTLNGMPKSERTNREIHMRIKTLKNRCQQVTTQIERYKRESKHSRTCVKLWQRKSKDKNSQCKCAVSTKGTYWSNRAAMLRQQQ